MREERKTTKKKRGHRKKKFGSQESKVISFRVGKDTYKEKKEEIREDVNNVLESYEISDAIEKPISDVEKINTFVKTEKDRKQKIFIINQEEYEQRDYIKEFTNKAESEQPDVTKNNRRSSHELMEPKNLDPQEVFSYFDRFKTAVKKPAQEDCIQKSEPEQTERENQSLQENYEQHRNDVEEQVKKDVKEIKEQDTKEIQAKKDLFEEFKEFIDKDNEEFKEFMD